LYDGTSGDLELLGLTGDAVVLAHATPASGGQVTVAGAAESPDGKRWLYSVVTYSGSGEATSRLYTGEIHSTPRLVATLSRPNYANRLYLGGYRVLRWEPGGVLLGTRPINVGGAGPFIAEGYALSNVVWFDPAAGSVSPPITCQGHGRFGDVAPDGSEACAAAASVVVVGPNGSVTTIANSETTVGQLAFVGGSSWLTWCATNGATSTGPGGAGWHDTLYSANLNTAQPSGTVLEAAANQSCEHAFGLDKVVDSTTIAELTGESPATSLSLVNVSTGQVRVVGPAEEIVGVL
jgi:hypothetical protein